MPIVVNLNSLMRERKMRTRELAERIDIVEKNVSRLRTGKIRAVRFSTLAGICEALQCQPGDILEYQPNSLFSKELSDSR